MTKMTYKRKGLLELTVPEDKSSSWLGSMAENIRHGRKHQAWKLEQNLRATS